MSGLKHFGFMVFFMFCCFFFISESKHSSSAIMATRPKPLTHHLDPLSSCNGHVLSPRPGGVSHGVPPVLSARRDQQHQRCERVRGSGPEPGGLSVSARQHVSPPPEERNVHRRPPQAGGQLGQRRHEPLTGNRRHLLP